MALKGNMEVKTALEEALKKYSATPEYAALLKKYHFRAPTADDLQTLMPKAEVMPMRDSDEEQIRIDGGHLSHHCPSRHA